jgi:ankyrin repeat protein
VNTAAKEENTTEANNNDITGVRPLHSAAFDGNMELLNLLIAHPKIDLDVVVANTLSTAMHGAVIEGDKSEVVEALLKAGANPNLRAIDGDTPLLKAITSQAMKSFKLLANHPRTDIRIKDQVLPRS